MEGEEEGAEKRSVSDEHTVQSRLTSGISPHILYI